MDGVAEDGGSTFRTSSGGRRGRGGVSFFDIIKEAESAAGNPKDMK